MTHGGAYPAGGGYPHADDAGLGGAASAAAKHAPEDQDFFSDVIGKMLQSKQPAQLADEDDIDEDGSLSFALPSPFFSSSPSPSSSSRSVGDAECQRRVGAGPHGIVSADSDAGSSGHRGRAGDRAGRGVSCQTWRKSADVETHRRVRRLQREGRHCVPDSQGRCRRIGNRGDVTNREGQRGRLARAVVVGRRQRHGVDALQSCFACN